MKPAWWFLGWVAVAAQAQAQDTSALDQAAATITAADLTRHIEVLAADSMRDRETPGRGDDRRARYIATQFQQFGLQPVAKDSTWIQRFPIPGQQVVSPTRSQLWFFITAFRRSGKDVIAEQASPLTMSSFLRFADGVRFMADPRPRAVTKLGPGWDRALGDSAHTVLVAGRHTAASIRRTVPSHKVVVYVPPADLDTASQRQVLAALAASSDGIVVLRRPDSAGTSPKVQLFDEYLQGAPATGQREAWIVELDPSAARGFLGAMDIDLPRLRADTVPMVRVLPFAQLQALFDADSVIAPATAVNVVGILPGADSTVRHQYVVLAAPMDTRWDAQRPDRGAGDGVAGGMDDRLSGVAGLLSLAKAFSQPGARPRRSIIFLAYGGDRRGRWGSNFFAWSLSSDWVELRNGVAAFTLDRIAGGAPPLAIDGTEDVDLGQPMAWMTARHPELGLTVVDGGTGANAESDALPFVRQGVPSLAFHRGASVDSLPVRNRAVAFDAELAARIARLVLYVGEAIATADRRPQWTRVGRDRYLGSVEP